MKPNARQLKVLCCWTALVAFTLVGCRTYPLGLSQVEWEALTPAQQAEYRARQHALDEERARRRAAEAALREQARQEAEARERARVTEAYRQARYGDIITVTVQDGAIAFYGKRHAYEPVAFDLVRGETRAVVFRKRGQPHVTTEILMHFSEDGNTFYFDQPSRHRFVAINDGWQRGREYARLNLGGHSEAEGIRIGVKCRLLPPAR